MKNKLHMLIFLVLCLSMILTQFEADSKEILAEFIGMHPCQKCHENESIGNQFKIWKASPHSKARQVLESEKSVRIALKIGLKNPGEDRKCLKCHTTGGGRSEITANEGVGCEACHGPGSRYNDFSNHASFDNRQTAYRKAVGLGMYPVLGIDGIKAREKLCRHCHDENRPCRPDDQGERKRQVLPLSLIADFPFKHPIRRR
jgi:hypothetical protein